MRRVLHPVCKPLLCGNAIIAQVGGVFAEFYCTFVEKPLHGEMLFCVFVHFPCDGVE